MSTIDTFDDDFEVPPPRKKKIKTEQMIKAEDASEKSVAILAMKTRTDTLKLHRSRTSKQLIESWKKIAKPPTDKRQHQSCWILPKVLQNTELTRRSKVRVSNRYLFSYQVAYFGSYPEVHLTNGYEISHLCHERRCVNPEHLTYEPKLANQQRQECLKFSMCPHTPRCLARQ